MRGPARKKLNLYGDERRIEEALFFYEESEGFRQGRIIKRAVRQNG